MRSCEDMIFVYTPCTFVGTDKQHLFRQLNMCGVYSNKHNRMASSGLIALTYTKGSL